jgi:hypothetical protein
MQKHSADWRADINPDIAILFTLMKKRGAGSMWNIVIENIVPIVSAKQIGAQGAVMNTFRRKVNISEFPVFGMS